MGTRPSLSHRETDGPNGSAVVVPLHCHVVARRYDAALHGVECRPVREAGGQMVCSPCPADTPR